MNSSAPLAVDQLANMLSLMCPLVNTANPMAPVRWDSELICWSREFDDHVLRASVSRLLANKYSPLGSSERLRVGSRGSRHGYQFLRLLHSPHGILLAPPTTPLSAPLIYHHQVLDPLRLLCEFLPMVHGAHDHDLEKLSAYFQRNDKILTFIELPTLPMNFGIVQVHLSFLVVMCLVVDQSLDILLRLVVSLC